ncbi:MAG TPA: branched-chain amino acid ABC transporter permease [Burkholderiales bacterium]|nr:branched-chain amino acid ABC transporter permease [Burkholderiales bacterium]
MPSATLLGQSILSGVFIGALYGLLGLGLSLSWGMLRQVNLAHFALAFLGGYLTFQLSNRLDPFVTLAVTVPLFFLAGVALHWFLSRYAADTLNTLLVTFGLTSIIEAGIHWFWTADFHRMDSVYANMRWKAGIFYIPLPEVVTLGFALLLCGAMWAALRFTDFGRAARAMTEDAAMAAAFGVNEKRLGYVISGLASAFAAVAGVCLALSHTLAPVQIYAWMGVVFAAVMIGGLGSALGPLLAGLLIGVSEAITMAVTAPTWAPLVSFSLLIAIIVLRPAKF